MRVAFPAGAPTEVGLKTRPLCVSAAAGSADRKQGPFRTAVHLRNMSFFGCTFSLGACYGCTATDLNLQFPSFAREVDFRKDRAPTGAHLFPAVTAMHGDDNLIERVHLAHSNIAGLVVVGSRNIIRQVLVEDTNWLGSLDFPAIQVAV